MGERGLLLLNITGRKRCERKREMGEEGLRPVADVTGEAIWDNDLLTGVQEWDAATEVLFGHPHREAETGARPMRLRLMGQSPAASRIIF